MVFSYQRFGTTYRSHPQGSRIQKKAYWHNTQFIQGRVWAVKSLSSVVPAKTVDASDSEGGSVVVSGALGRDTP